MDNKFFDLFDTDDIAKLADIVCDKELSEITLSDGNKSITIKGKKCPPPPPPHQPPMMPPPPMGAPMQQPPMGAPMQQPAMNAAPNAAPTADKISGNVVKSPIVGTYYASPSPDKEPFVKVGDTVKKGDVIMIIESMKLMNEVQSDFDGVVKQILVENGAAVEYDQPIMIIE
jgi:acetyl-CoA carboxylase biotin carboxyl carrier protein